MTTLEVTAYTGLGAGAHEVVVTDVTVKKAVATGGEYLRWEFRDSDDKAASANTSLEVTPGNKTGKWFSALTGRPVVIGEKRDTAEVIGKPASIFIELNREGYPKVISVTGRQADPRTVQSFAQSQTPAYADTPGTKADVDAAAAQHAVQEGDGLPF